MDAKEIKRIFYRDGYRLALEHLDQGVHAVNLTKAIKQLYQAVDDLLESFIQRSRTEGVPPECKKGCSWCCHQEVFAVTHEFFYLQDHLRMNLSEEVRERILERAGEKVMLTKDLSLEEQLKVRSACPLLDAGSCLAYEARPMACRIYLSTSERSCKRDHDRPGNQKNIPELLEFPLIAGRMLNEGFVACLKQYELMSFELPIEQGYVSLATHGQTMEEWIKNKSS
ncbi:MAG: YkgJ family cysteine cluster protein [Bacteroidota bacterium]|nr:YkgJ family cysteine cluster protein [Bacteroidota bacterium]